VTDGYLAAPESAALVIAGSLDSGTEMTTADLTNLMGNLTATHPNIRSTQRFVRLPDADNPPGWLPATPQWPDGLAN
jgi:hypothetical protein